MAGVSQTTVSLVLNHRTEADVRIAPETRERVLRVIRETGYAADPVARRLAAGRNRILGVFTYEAVFPTTGADFYHPFLIGIEERAEEAGCDLLLFTSAGARAGGRRRIFGEDSRVRLADGCLLLGRTQDREDLARMVAEGIPFVSVGRRDDAGGPVPYVGADYVSATSALVERALALGHRRMAYIGAGDGAESTRDRKHGFHKATTTQRPSVAGGGEAVHPLAVGGEAAHLPAAEPVPVATSAPLAAGGGEGRRRSLVAGGEVETIHLPAVSGGAAGLVEAIVEAGVTAAFVEDEADAVAMVRVARERGIVIPRDLSLLTLGAPTRPVRDTVVFTGFRIPREEMGRRAVELLTEVLENGGAPQELLACELIEGTTLAPPNPAS